MTGHCDCCHKVRGELVPAVCYCLECGRLCCARCGQWFGKKGCRCPKCNTKWRDYLES